jgi:flagellar L-ring protein precursor FlgH
VGDLLTVSVTIDDRAALSNESARSRRNSDDLGLPSFFGFESRLDRILPNAVNPGSLVDMSSDMSNLGRGNVRRARAWPSTSRRPSSRSFPTATW